MFEDSTFESAGRIGKASKSKYWMMVTLITNGSILVLLILIPLIYPEALPHNMMLTVLTAPPPPPPPPPPEIIHVVKVQSEMMNNQLVAPTKIPKDIKVVADKEPPPSQGFGVAGMEGLGGAGNGVPGAFAGTGDSGPKVKAAAPKKVNSSGGVAQGMLLNKTTPLY